MDEQTVPMVSPLGNSGDIPASQVTAAMKAGFKRAVVMTSPKGNQGYVPMEQAGAAIQNGFRPGQPAANAMADRGNNNPGFFSNLGSDLSAMATPIKAAYEMSQADPSKMQNTVNLIGQGASAGREEAGMPGWFWDQNQRNINRMAEGHGPLYTALAGINEMATGANVQGMEQSAKTGDVLGVAGHAAAVPTAMAATAGISKGIELGLPPAISNAKAAFTSMGGGNPTENLAGALAKRAGNIDVHTEIAQPLGSLPREAARELGQTPESYTGRFGQKAAVDLAQKIVDDHEASIQPFKNRYQAVDVSPEIEKAVGEIQQSIPRAVKNFSPEAQRVITEVTDRLRTARTVGDLDVIRKWLNNDALPGYYRIATTEGQISAGTEINTLNRVADKVREIEYGKIQELSGTDLRDTARREGAAIKMRSLLEKETPALSNEYSASTSQSIKDRFLQGKSFSEGTKQALLNQKSLDLFNNRMRRALFSGESPSKSAPYPRLQGQLQLPAGQEPAIPLNAVPSANAPGTPAMNMADLLTTRAARKGLLLNAAPIELPGQVEPQRMPPVLTRQGGEMPQSGQPFRGGQATPLFNPQAMIDAHSPVFDPRMAAIMEALKKRRR